MCRELFKYGVGGKYGVDMVIYRRDNEHGSLEDSRKKKRLTNPECVTHARERNPRPLCDRDPNKHWKFRTRSKVDDCVKERKEEEERNTYIRNRCERRGETEESR